MLLCTFSCTQWTSSEPSSQPASSWTASTSLQPTLHRQPAQHSMIHFPLPLTPVYSGRLLEQGQDMHLAQPRNKQPLYLETLPNLPLPVVPCIVDQQYTQLSVNPTKQVSLLTFIWPLFYPAVLLLLTHGTRPGLACTGQCCSTLSASPLLPPTSLSLTPTLRFQTFRVKTSSKRYKKQPNPGCTSVISNTQAIPKKKKQRI